MNWYDIRPSMCFDVSFILWPTAVPNGSSLLRMVPISHELARNLANQRARVSSHQHGHPDALCSNGNVDKSSTSFGVHAYTSYQPAARDSLSM